MSVHKPSMSRNQSALDQSSLKTFALWIAWSAISVTVFIQLYHSSGILTFIQQDRLHVTWVLLGVFAFGVLISFMHVFFLTREWFSSSRLEYRLMKHGLQGVKLERNRATSRLIESLQHIDHSGGKVDLNALSTVEFSSHIRTSRFVGLLGSMLITLGLVGTVLGLTMTLTGLNGALENVSSDGVAMLLGIREAMEGMGMAFYTTLLGSIMGGVLLRMFAYITDNSIESL
ncbi:MAG: MotA/TolQ/ExbB proton channel family protein, partial [Mariprofundaceae bacterium]|nr:MotA/TolQ/ExbB proton channel family protein [Mariprofundaceae bacterium]